MPSCLPELPINVLSCWPPCALTYHQACWNACLAHLLVAWHASSKDSHARIDTFPACLFRHLVNNRHVRVPSVCFLEHSGLQRLTPPVSVTPLQNIGGLVRYMTLAHRRDFIEAALRLIGHKKMLGIVEYLRKRWQDVCVLLGEGGSGPAYLSSHPRSVQNSL